MKLRRARRRRGLSQLGLARKAHVSQGYLSELESGIEKNPGIAVLRRLAKALGVPVARLLE